MLETSALLARYLCNLTLINLFGPKFLYTREKLLSLVEILKLSLYTKSKISSLMVDDC